jgi:hypothetical protein
MVYAYLSVCSANLAYFPSNSKELFKSSIRAAHFLAYPFMSPMNVPRPISCSLFFTQLWVLHLSLMLLPGIFTSTNTANISIPCCGFLVFGERLNILDFFTLAACSCHAVLFDTSATYPSRYGDLFCICSSPITVSKRSRRAIHCERQKPVRDPRLYDKYQVKRTS